MANYYLTVDKQKIIEFNKIPNFNNLKYKSLIDIVEFTSYFRDETHLKETLLNYKLIKETEFNKRLSIIYNYNKEVKTLMYGLTYEDDKKYFDIEYITYYLKSKKNDYVFLEKLCNRYRNSYLQGTNIILIRNYLNYVKFNREIERELEEEFDETINSFIKLELFSYDKKNKTYKLKYKSLRDLAMFIAYNQRKEEQEEIKKYQKIEKQEKIKKDEKVDKPKVKVKKKNKDIDGQMSFEDMGWI
ncbi:MAG: hypothetical protein J6K21_01735 [Bacilli bacterium]|nr:hypothetical protein [Bacilli bacterium]